MDKKLSYILDTCILIDYLRGEQSVYDLLVNNSGINLSMSTVTMMELIIGALNKREVNYIQKAFSKIDIIYIDIELITYNISDFVFIPDIKLYHFA